MVGIDPACNEPAQLLTADLRTMAFDGETWLAGFEGLDDTLGPIVLFAEQIICVHDFPEGNYIVPPAKLLNFTCVDFPSACFKLLRGRGNTAGYCIEHIQKRGKVHIGLQSLNSKDIGHLMAIGNNRCRAMGQSRIREFRRTRHGRLDMHVDIDESRDYNQATSRLPIKIAIDMPDGLVEGDRSEIEGTVGRVVNPDILQVRHD